MVLSKEEKKAKKEAKLREKLRAETELRKKVKRGELMRELAAQSLKKKQLDKAWRELMMKIKEPEFKQDIEILWHIFERAYDQKNHVINYTMKLSDVADDQFQRTVANFCVVIDKMVVNFLEDLDLLSKQNDKRTDDLLRAGEEEVAQIMKDHNAAETHLQLLIFHGHFTADTTAWTTRGEDLVRQDEDSTKYANERDTLRSFLEDSYNFVWDEYKFVLKNYIVGTADIQKEVRKLRFKENIMSDIIASQGKKIANSGGLLKRLRTELAAYEGGEKQAIFRNRRDRHRAACHKLKKRLINGCATDANQMAVLVKASDGAIEWLEYVAKKGEKILRLAALCRKFEGQREKVMPFGSNRPFSPTKGKSETRKFKKLEDPMVAEAISTTSGLTRLWQRISKAELTKRALEREKQLLEQENAYIMRKINEFQENKYGPGSQKCICIGTPVKKGAINPPTSIKGILEICKYKKA